MTEEKKCPVSFNSIANVLASISAVGLAGIIGAGTYVFVNKDAIIENIKEQAIEAVLGGAGGLGALGGATDALPVGSPDLAPPADQAAAPQAPAGFGLPQ
tara:strand:+ start:560 stop:859 length:300 start_codon:yes stop_codon:yes gene_type:complete